VGEQVASEVDPAALCTARTSGIGRPSLTMGWSA
jgi:hypothetical protein